MVLQYCKDLDAHHIYTSAKTGKGVHDCFLTLTKSILARQGAKGGGGGGGGSGGGRRTKRRGGDDDDLDMSSSHIRPQPPRNTIRIDDDEATEAPSKANEKKCCK